MAIPLDDLCIRHELTWHPRVQATEKAKLAAQQFCERLGRYRMPFAWAAIMLSDATAFCCGDVNPPVEMELYQQNTEKQTPDDLFKYLADLKKAPDKRTTTKKLKKIQGVLRLHVQELRPGASLPLCLTPSLYRVKPWPADQHERPIVEIQVGAVFGRGFAGDVCVWSWFCRGWIDLSNTWSKLQTPHSYVLPVTQSLT